MLLKKTIIDKLSLMPEEYFLYYEELDWCTYINREGYELWYLSLIHIEMCIRDSCTALLLKKGLQG